MCSEEDSQKDNIKDPIEYSDKDVPQEEIEDVFDKETNEDSDKDQRSYEQTEEERDNGSSDIEDYMLSGDELDVFEDELGSPEIKEGSLADRYGNIGPMWDPPVVTLVYRNEWGARPPVERHDLRFPVKNVIFTQTKTEECHNKEDCIKIVKQLQEKHISDGFTDIKYNFLAGSDKVVYEGRGWKTMPDKNEKYPDLYKKCIEIAYIGNFDEEEPPMWMMEPPWGMLEHALMNDQLVIRFRVHEDYYQPKSLTEDLEKKYCKKDVDET